MQFLVNPTIAYALIVTGVILFFLTNLMPKSRVLMIAMVICLLGAGYELVILRGNPWALILVGLSPVAFLVGARQTRWFAHLLTMGLVMLTVGAMALLVDQNGQTTVNYGVAALFSIACGEIVWITIGRRRYAEALNSRDNPPPVVGMIGKVRTEIGIGTPGLVEIEGELWSARSKEPIEPGSTVRVLRCEGPVLTVKKAEKLTRE